MAGFIVFLGIVVAVWAALSKSKSRTPSSKSSRQTTKKLSKRASSLYEIFNSETLDLGQQWRFEAASDRQISLLTELAEDENISIPASLSKGQASDAIGIFNPPEDHEIAQLKFFKTPSPSRLNQTEARIKLHEIFSSSDNLEQWKSRPASTEQKDQIRFFGVKAPKELSHPDAEAMLANLVSANTVLHERWCTIRSAYDELVDPDVREDYGLKKFSWKQFYEVVTSAEDSGQQLSEILADEDALLEAILLKHPALED